MYTEVTLCLYTAQTLIFGKATPVHGLPNPDIKTPFITTMLSVPYY